MLNSVGNNAENQRPLEIQSAASSARETADVSGQPKFGDVWNQIQSAYGAKSEKPREAKKTLGKDDFLKIMITQMKHQDPTQPFKAEQFATELAQFASIEQLQNVNQSLNKMSNQNNPLERLAMTNLIGKTVTIDRQRFPYTAGTNQSISFALPKDSTKTRVLIVADNGETVLEKDLGPLKAGENSFNWDGLKNNTFAAKTGNYTLNIDARDDHELPIAIQSKGQAKVIGLSFEGSEPVLLIGDANHQSKVSMQNIVQIGSEGISQPISQNNFIAFQKGVGSNNLDQSKLTPEAVQALTQYERHQQVQGKQEVQNRPMVQNIQQAQNIYTDNEKGFPNGLQEAADLNEDNKLVQKGGENNER